MLSDLQREKIRGAFVSGTLRVRSVSPVGQVEWRRVHDVQRAEVPWEEIHEAWTPRGPFVLTGGHRVFTSPTSKTEMCSLKAGDQVLGVSDQGLADAPVIQETRQIESRQYMYDLTAEAWHNFVLHRSGVVVSNSPDKFYKFRPPEHEANIGQFNRVFGQIWEDQELLQYLERALDWFNMMPPMTREIRSIDMLASDRRTSGWTTAILWGAISHACFALMANWSADEFSVAADTCVAVYLPDGRRVDLPIAELHAITTGEA